MLMNKKMIFFDIDGTLLDHEQKVPDSTKDAIAYLKTIGHEVAIATGRAPFMFESLRIDLGIDSYVCLNGQYVVFKGIVIFRNAIGDSLLHSLTEAVVAHDHAIVYMGVNEMKSNVAEHRYIQSSIGPLHIEIPGHDPLYYLHHDVYQAMVFCPQDDEPVYRSTFTDLHFVRWHPVSMDVVPATGSKAQGIARMIEATGIAREDTYAFGDNYNDIEMLKFVGHGVSMGNAPDLVKKAAKYVTKNVNDDGVLHGLKLVGLL
jgi:Cof subfamily protein (haloacid dehalogenase superfamily)